MLQKVTLPNLCLQNIVYKPEDLKRSFTTDTLSHDGHKSGTPKTNRKGEGDKEKGKPAASTKSGPRQEMVVHRYSTMTQNNKTALNLALYVLIWLHDVAVLHTLTHRQHQLKTMHCICIYLFFNISAHFSTVYFPLITL